jgi:hypothetical protein
MTAHAENPRGEMAIISGSLDHLLCQVPNVPISGDAATVRYAAMRRTVDRATHALRLVSVGFTGMRMATSSAIQRQNFLGPTSKWSLHLGPRIFGHSLSSPDMRPPDRGTRCGWGRLAVFMPSGAQMMQDTPNNVAKFPGPNQVASRVAEIEHPRRAAGPEPFQSVRRQEVAAAPWDRWAAVCTRVIPRPASDTT